MFRSYNKACMLLCLVGAALCQSDKAGPFSRQPWNIKGDVLILDVGSLKFQGNHPMFPPFNEDGCADACARTPGCNAWTYCSKKDGCGSGCAAYVAKNPPLRPASGPNDNPTQPNLAWNGLAAITGFGPWGVTANCKYVCANNGEGPCNPGDAWPNGMCTLKKLQDPVKPEFWSTNAGEGFISGFTKPPPECTSISVRTCTRCIRSQDPFNCLKCANNPMWKVSMLAGALDPSMGKADGCSSCYDSTVPDKCVECLTSNAPCAQCALEQPDAAVQMNVASCINCTQRHGQTFKSACISCSQLGAQPESVSQCNSCLEAMKPLACDKTDYNPGCWNPEVHSGACNTCASRAQSFGTCLACMKSSPYSGDCESCALLDPAKQDDCYHCAKSAAHAGSGCSDCFRDLSDPSQLQQCVGCLSNPKIGAEGKDWCYGCQNWCSTFDTRAQCIACLGTPQDTYWSACSCNNYLSAQ